MKLSNVAAVTLSTFISGSALAELPHIKNLVVNPTPPGATVGAAYFNLHNPNNSAVTLKKVSSPAINRVEMHLSEVVNDVAKMHKLESVEVAAEETFNFSHGGYHLMLMDLEEPLFPGDLIPIVFHTDQGDVTVEARVAEKIALPKDGMQAMEHDKMDHGEMDHDKTDHEKSKHEEMSHGETKHDDLSNNTTIHDAVKEDEVKHDG